MMLRAEETALILIGYQNDYFSEDGVLHSFIEGSCVNVLNNTITLMQKLKDTDVTMVELPIAFTPDYDELDENASGILNVIRDKKAFQRGTKGCETIPEFEQFQGKLMQLSGKRGLNAFNHTQLHEQLGEKGVKNIILAGAVTSVCIDSTARAATEKGYSVTILSDCTSARSELEQDFFCSNIFPIYAHVMDSQALMDAIEKKAA